MGDLPHGLELFDDLSHANGIADSRPWRHPLGQPVIRLAPQPTLFCCLRGNQSVECGADRLIHELDLRTDQVVEQEVSLCFRTSMRTAQIQVAIETKAGTSGGSLSAVVRLGATSPYQQVAPVDDRIAEQKLIVAGLVPSE